MDDAEAAEVAYPTPPPPGFQLLSCSSAADFWDERWFSCPVCAAVPDSDGLFVHRDPEFLIN